MLFVDLEDALHGQRDRVEVEVGARHGFVGAELDQDHCVLRGHLFL